MPSTTDNERDPWWTTDQIASATGDSVWLVRKSLHDPRRADALYGAENWTDRPSLLSRRREYRVRRSAVLKLATGANNAAEDGTTKE
jgi:hypothetical protein